MWLDSGLCKLCLIYSRSKDLINLGREDRLPKLLIHLADIIEGGRSRSQAFASAFNVVKDLVEKNDPYAKVKAELNTLGKRLSDTVKKYLEENGWSISKAMRISAAANIIDTSVLGYEAKNLEEALWDSPAIEEVVSIPRNDEVYLVLDNAGEAYVDLLLARALKIHGYRVSIVIRKESYEIDVLRPDLEIDEDINIIETPGNLPPVLYIDSGFIIAKGIANAEAYAESGKAPSLHLLRAKCDVIAKLFRVPKNAVLIVSGNTIKKVFSSSVS